MAREILYLPELTSLNSLLYREGDPSQSSYLYSSMEREISTLLARAHILTTLWGGRYSTLLGRAYILIPLRGGEILVITHMLVRAHSGIHEHI
jgi:hypothetical protein